MNLKFKGTLVILSLMLLASFILAKRQEVKNNSDQIKSDLPTQHSSVFTQIENNKIICVKKSKFRINTIHNYLSLSHLSSPYISRTYPIYISYLSDRN